MSEREHEEEFRARPIAVWMVYAGPSLRNADAPPIQISMQFDVLGALWAKNNHAWNALIYAIEKKIRAQKI